MKKYFLTGLLILTPIVLTIIIAIFIIDLFTNPFLNLVSEFLKSFETKISWMTPRILTFLTRIVILFLLFLVIFLLGLLGRWFLFRSILNLMNALFSKIPLIKTVYKVSKDIVFALFSHDKEKAFKRPILSPFLHKEGYCIGFETGKVPEACQEKVPYPLTSVFIPTAPHPISGFLVMVPSHKLLPIQMNNEDAVKFTVSCGVIDPTLPQEGPLDYGKK
ncbi:MAG: DUF502 domain-containing protein [Parachlamydiales bacterium]|nr:DUF502 domain-containing protein [Parachlamydiales bacterium]